MKNMLAITVNLELMKKKTASSKEILPTLIIEMEPLW
jgi:hypothetical protein